jgi:phospholipid transport system substrate-binding protein
MMLHTRSVTLLALAALLLAPLAVAQPAQEIEQLLRQRDREIKQILGTSGQPTAQQRERLRAVVNDAIDFEAMAQVALGPFWSELSAAQRSAFTERFAAVVRQQSLSDLDLYRATVAYEGVDVRGTTATARTVATRGSTRARVDYTLHRTGGRWRVTDIIIDGTGTAENYARSFQRVLRRDGVQTGYDRLMQSLQRRLDRGE